MVSINTNLKVVFDSLGYTSPKQHSALLGLLADAKAFSPEAAVSGVSAAASELGLASPEAAHAWLVSFTQDHFLRPKNKERSELPSAHPLANEATAQRLAVLGLRKEVRPSSSHYDCVAILGSTKDNVKSRTQYCKQLTDKGLTCDTVYMLGDKSEMNLMARVGRNTFETSFAKGATVQLAHCGPTKIVKVGTVAPPTNTKGRSTTFETIEDWRQQYECDHPDQQTRAKVLFVTNQPYVQYQDAIIRSILPKDRYEVETVGRETVLQNKLSVGLDALARTIYASQAAVKEKLAPTQPATAICNPPLRFGYSQNNRSFPRHLQINEIIYF